MTHRRRLILDRSSQPELVSTAAQMLTLQLVDLDGGDLLSGRSKGKSDKSDRRDETANRTCLSVCPA